MHGHRLSAPARRCRCSDSGMHACCVCGHANVKVLVSSSSGPARRMSERLRVPRLRRASAIMFRILQPDSRELALVRTASLRAF